MSPEKICPTCGTEYPANARFCDRDGTALRSQGGGADLVGSIIAERYHVLKKLGEGGMGQVYLAEHVKMGRKSAVKVMNPGMVHDADAISRFNREAANASRINHPNVAGIYDFGETADGLIYLAMEFIEGESLTALVEKNGALPPMRAADIAKQAADGLSVAHDMGIVHRDLKPDNIMIAKNRDGSDCVKVVDFGIAKAAGSENQKVTKTGLVVGTPEYMSPEQLAGDKLDGRSDIYSLALVAYNMLTGKLPFEGETAQESMIMRLTDDPRPLALTKPDTSWPKEVQDVIEKALQRKREARYDSAAKFGVALYQAVERMPKPSPAGATQLIGAMEGATAVLSPPPKTRLDASAAAGVAPPPPTGVAGPARSKTPVVAGVGGTVILAAAAAAFVLSTRTTPKQPAADTSKTATSVTALPATPVHSSGAPAVVPPSRTAGKPTQAGTPSTIPKSPATVTETPPASMISYEQDLDALYESILDSVSATKAAREIPDFAQKIKTPGDRAALDMIKAKSFLLTSGLNRACPIFRAIKKADLPAKLKSDLDDGVQSCTSP